MGLGWEELRLLNFKILKVIGLESVSVLLQNYPSIRALKNVNSGSNFNFSVVSAITVEKEIKNLNILTKLPRVLTSTRKY